MKRVSERRDQILALVCLGGAFGLTAVTDLRLLVVLFVLSALIFQRGLWGVLRTVFLLVGPVALGLALTTALWQAFLEGRTPSWGVLSGVALRALLIAFFCMSLAKRIDWFRALAFSESLSRLLSVTFAQIHVFRRLRAENLQCLESRLIEKPRPRHFLGSAVTFISTLFILSLRNSRDVADAMRSRGF